ncbi:MAG: CAAX protease [Veillonella sp.]|uniref:CAAX protease n=1 Tax=Veillonella sp. TaxID=1926307 RepID=UPI00290A789A|nr:CAAX protease [Veillonella sp.]MDU6398389.1 CAAX protease [Veillonella sp.]
MAKKQHKERIQQPKESQTASTLIKLFFLISFIVLGFFVFNDMPINWILSVYAVDILVSLIYVVINKGRIATSNVVHTNVRRILAFLIMLITMFFYAFALWRVDQYTTQMQVTLFIGGIIIYYAIFNSTKNLIKK